MACVKYYSINWGIL